MCIYLTYVSLTFFDEKLSIHFMDLEFQNQVKLKGYSGVAPILGEPGMALRVGVRWRQNVSPLNYPANSSIWIPLFL